MNAASNNRSGQARRNRNAGTATYFLSLELENIRCFGERQTVEFVDESGRPIQWTVILGDNGVGKTTLLQALAGAEEHPKYEKSKDFVLARFARHNYQSFLRSDQNENGSINIEISIGSNIKEQNNEINKSSCVFEFLNELGSDGVGLRGAMRWGPWNNTDLDLFQENFFCYGYGAGRRIGSSSLSEDISDDTAATLFSENASLLNAEEWLMQADYAASKTKSNQSISARRRDRIKSLLEQLLPDVSDIRFVRRSGPVEMVGVQFKTPYGWVNIRDLSLGYRVLIAWMVDFASRMFKRYPNHKDPFAQPAIVLIDEIDLHLHPKWQRQLVSYLTELFPNTQFIVTAHSPLFVQSAVGANVVVLRREKDHVVIDNNPMAVQGWRVDQILTSDLFGLPSARSPDLDESIEQRDKILSKKRITKKDREKLMHLERKIADMPSGESLRDMEAMRILRQAAESLK